MSSKAVSGGELEWSEGSKMVLGGEGGEGVEQSMNCKGIYVESNPKEVRGWSIQSMSGGGVPGGDINCVYTQLPQCGLWFRVWTEMRRVGMCVN